MVGITENATFTLAFDPKEIPALARAYGPEQDDIALAAGCGIRDGKYTRENLTKIFEWKTGGRGRSRLTRNTDDEIADALRLTVSAATERAAIAVLLGLNGVQVPVASAILTAIDPVHYTVIDFRALEALCNASVDRSINFYLRYLAACSQIAASNGVTLRDLDRALWKWSESHSPYLGSE